MIHQKDTATKLNRYPSIFRFCYDNKPKKKCKILSFGSSSGEELVSLSMHFGESEIYGVEIDSNCLKKSQQLTRSVERISASNKIPDLMFDIIFCMSVLCRWPDTQNLEDCSNIYSFQEFESKIIEIDKYLNKNGLLVIHNSNFIFEDTIIHKNYELLGSFDFSGLDGVYVDKFNKEHKKIYEKYNNVVFKKVKL